MSINRAPSIFTDAIPGQQVNVLVSFSDSQQQLKLTPRNNFLVFSCESLVVFGFPPALILIYLLCSSKERLKVKKNETDTV